MGKKEDEFMTASPDTAPQMKPRLVPYKRGIKVSKRKVRVSDLDLKGMVPTFESGVTGEGSGDKKSDDDLKDLHIQVRILP